MTRRVAGVLAVAGAAILMFAGVQAASAAKTVTISGKAFVFNHMDTYISGATIKVREFPKISTTTDDLGDYVLTVPDDANVTPYIESGEGLLTRHNKADNTPKGTVQTHWNEIDLQTFHTRGENIVNANFQSPQDAEYNGLMALLSVPKNPETGRPEQCAIVTTSSARDVRDVDYLGYWENTPHGVPGATSIEFPAIDGPIYFNEFVIPDKTKTSSSEDGGIIWPVVPTGTYRIVTSAPDAQFASFLATCAPGRVVNANPPWGAYELSPGEKPLGASNVAANLISAKVARMGKTKRILNVKLNIGEPIDAQVKVKTRSKSGSSTQSKVTLAPLKPGVRTVTFKIGSKVTGQKATVVVKLKDASGVSFTTVRTVNLPKVIKKSKRS